MSCSHSNARMRHCAHAPARLLLICCRCDVACTCRVVARGMRRCVVGFRTPLSHRLVCISHLHTTTQALSIAGPMLAGQLSGLTVFGELKGW